MFSNNQELVVSGELSNVKLALEFAMVLSDEIKHLKPSEVERGYKMLYQITEDEKFCIGRSYKDVPDGWAEFQFGFDFYVVARTIELYLEKQTAPINWRTYGVDNLKKGFVMKSCVSMGLEKAEKIANNSYCIVAFEPHAIFYSK